MVTEDAQIPAPRRKRGILDAYVDEARTIAVLTGDMGKVLRKKKTNRDRWDDVRRMDALVKKVQGEDDGVEAVVAELKARYPDKYASDTQEGRNGGDG